ncbi:serine hydrolase domain-containing protein [Nocardiopsis halotolerans]|uniref:serine hydrolase domain-containing protein n=1 Tax=Nocardiopsis halotolerans TaxID=124252 RepID=UPI000346F27E|nr:serine hydrolase domain-containing protein [Nocardiopsis halotolerans]
MTHASHPGAGRGTTRRRFVGQAAALLSGCALAATGALAGCSSPRESVGAAIDDFLADAVPEGAGLTVLAAHRGEIVYCAGRGAADRGSGIGAGCGTVYDIGSVTKQFTAAAVLGLETDGALATADPLSRFLDGMPGDKGGITLHQLLTHTSGLPDRLGGDYDVLTREDMLAAVAGSELLSTPGTEHRYSNTGYSVLAAVVEEVSGTGYEEYLATRLFTPARMARTGYVLPRWDPAQIAVEYDASGTPAGRPHERRWNEDGPYWNLRGNGGLLSTAPDMFRWHRALEGNRVLPEAAKEKLFTPHVREGDSASYYGYGWVVEPGDGGTTVWHNGSNGRSYAEFTRFLDEGLMVFWATGDVRRDGAWNLQELDLTRGTAECAREHG